MPKEPGEAGVECAGGQVEGAQAEVSGAWQSRRALETVRTSVHCELESIVGFGSFFKQLY